MTTAAKIQAPDHLSGAMREWWASVEEAHTLEPHHRHLLQLAAEAYDRAQGAREILDGQGTTYSDRFSQPKLRPEATIERDARRDFGKLLAQLNLDEEPPA